MSKIETSRSRGRRMMLQAALVAALSTGTLAIGGIEQGTQNGVAFENGGVSVESADEIKAHAAKFPVMLVFAWNEGNYLADVNIQVQNQKGDPVLSLDQQGPIVLLDLPKGSYSVKVERNGKSQKRMIRVGSGTRTKVVFHWPRDERERDAIADARR